MRKQEQKLWDRMRHSLKDHVYLERIENVVNPGRPDVDALWDGIVLPIELKALETFPKRPMTPVLGGAGLNQNQLNWWLNWKRWGGSGFIVVGIEGEVFAVPAKFSDEVNDWPREKLAWHRVSWQELIKQIKLEAQCLQRRCITKP
jgi:hypothetical protein